MTFHYRDADGHEVETVPEVFDGQPVVTIWVRGEYNTRVPVRIPVDRLEEFIAGARDTGRQAASQEQPA